MTTASPSPRKPSSPKREPLRMGPSSRATPSILSQGAPTEPKAGRDSRLTVDVPANLKRRLRLAAADRDVTIREIVVAALERELG